MKIGVISDTHGKIRSKAIEGLKGSEYIIHAGDIGNKEVLDILNSIAPVYAVRGNIDKNQWSDNIPMEIYLNIDKINIYVIHDIKKINIEHTLKDIDIVISGHSHKHSKIIRDNVIYLNPGSAGNKRFKLPLTIATINITHDIADIDFIYL